MLFNKIQLLRYCNHLIWQIQNPMKYIHWKLTFHLKPKVRVEDESHPGSVSTDKGIICVFFEDSFWGAPWVFGLTTQERRLGLWFRPVCGRAFAGMFDAEDLKTLEICGTCQIPEAKGWVGWVAWLLWWVWINSEVLSKEGIWVDDYPPAIDISWSVLEVGSPVAKTSWTVDIQPNISKYKWWQAN